MNPSSNSQSILDKVEIAHCFDLPMTTEELIREPVLDSVRVRVTDSIDPLMTSGCDLGVAEPSTKIEGVTILLGRSANHESALHTLLGELLNPSSPFYRRRLSKEVCAALFGLVEEDVQKITFWLESQSLESIKVSPARTAVSFAGTLLSVETAFRTQFRRFRVEGREYLANAHRCSVPAAFSAVIKGVCNLSILA